MPHVTMEYSANLESQVDFDGLCRAIHATGLFELGAARLNQYGDSIKAGEIVLSGSFIRPKETQKGTLIEADFGDFGQVSCRF